MGRLLWFAVGAGVTVFAVVKVRQVVERNNPKAIGQRVAGSASGFAERAQDFAHQVRAGMAEREAELRTELKMPGAASAELGPTD